VAHKNRPSPGTLALLYDEIADEQRSQQDLGDQLNQRAQQLFSFVAVILALLPVAIPEDPCLWEKIAVIAAIPLLALAALFSGQAWGFRTWRRDPSGLKLWERYRLNSEEIVRHQVIQNRLQAIEHNRSLLTTKRRAVKRAQWSLYVAVAYVAALVLYRILIG
jgi:hypothetical protein